MMKEKLSTLIGMAGGIFAKILTGNIMSAILIAAVTGSAAYISQEITKYLHKKFRKIKKAKSK